MAPKIATMNTLIRKEASREYRRPCTSSWTRPALCLPGKADALDRSRFLHLFDAHRLGILVALVFLARCHFGRWPGLPHVAPMGRIDFHYCDSKNVHHVGGANALHGRGQIMVGLDRALHPE